MSLDNDNLEKKALFTCPGTNGNDQEDFKTNSAMNNCCCFEIEHETVELMKKTQKDMHEKRMKKFRQMAKQLAEDDWLYQSVEKLIGLK